MTREFIEQLDVVEPNCYETDREEIWYKVGLVDGLKIADENPKNVWHDASEEPKGEYEIMCQDEFEYVWLTNCRETIENYKNGWEECAYSECIARWAYIKDLLPKGGEE